MGSPSIVVGWNGLPAYGARLIQAGRDHLGVQFPVLGTKPDVPIDGMEEILGDGLKWLEAGRSYSWGQLKMPVPELFIHTGWGYSHFNSLADEVRANGGKVVGMFDNCWKPTLRQFIGSIYFRMFLRRKYFAAWVPGKSGKRLAKQLGFGVKRVFVGMYGSSSEVFSNKVPMSKRKKQVLFVGRLIHRKGVVELAQAFSRIHEEFPDWSLLIVGEGECKVEVDQLKGVKVLPFKQPEEISRLMNQSRVFALASREEHWGLVVHEAALSGCALMLQAQIGAAADFASEENAVLFARTNQEDMVSAFREIFQWPAPKFVQASHESQQVASAFGLEKWSKQLEKIVQGSLK